MNWLLNLLRSAGHACCWSKTMRYGRNQTRSKIYSNKGLLDRISSLPTFPLGHAELLMSLPWMYSPRYTAQPLAKFQGQLRQMQRVGRQGSIESPRSGGAKNNLLRWTYLDDGGRGWRCCRCRYSYQDGMQSLQCGTVPAVGRDALVLQQGSQR